MTQIDFYLLGDSARHNTDSVTCRLVQKAYQQGHQVCVLTQNREHSQKLDQLMWTFDPNSFIPHEVQENGSDNNTSAPVIITHETPPENLHDILISLGDKTPAGFSRFNRLAEIIDNSDNAKEQARERYRFYRDRGYPLNTHEL